MFDFLNLHFRSYKLNCPSFIELALDKTKQFLEIFEMNLQHLNHEGSGVRKKFNKLIWLDNTDKYFLQENVRFYPEKRRLSEKEIKEVLKMYRLNVKPAKILQVMTKRTKKLIKLKDLKNIIQKLKE